MDKKILFVCAMACIIMLSNHLLQYEISFFLTLAAFTYPVAFLVTDLANRLYGARFARSVVVTGFAGGFIGSLILVEVDWLTFRIALGSGVAFFSAHLLDIAVFNRLRHLTWWKTPMISSAVGSIFDTILFFFIAFSAFTYGMSADGNAWAFQGVAFLDFGPDMPLWMSMAVADLCVKFLMIFFLLPCYLFFLKFFFGVYPSVGRCSDEST